MAGLGLDRPEREGIPLAFGQNVRSLRVAADLPQEQLARRCFLRNDVISGLGRGVRIAWRPGIGTDALAESLKLPSWYVVWLVRCLEANGEVVPQRTGWQLVSKILSATKKR